MADMNRRHFLTGTVAAAAGGTALALAMPDKALELFAPTVGEIMAVNRPSQATPDEFKGGVAEYGEFVFNAKGQVIGVIREVHFQREHIDITSMGSNIRTAVPGPASYTLVVQGIAVLGIGRGRA